MNDRTVKLLLFCYRKLSNRVIKKTGLPVYTIYVHNILNTILNRLQSETGYASVEKQCLLDQYCLRANYVMGIFRTFF